MLAEITPNTSEWLEFRKNKIGASDAPFIMGESRYGTPYDLYLKKKGLKEQVMHKGMIRGHEREPITRKAMEDKYFMTFEPCVLIHPDHEWMIASLDAINVDRRMSLEIKNCNEKDHEIARSGKIPLTYRAQIQHQMEVLLAKYGEWMHIYVSDFNGDIVEVPISIDHEYVEGMIEKEKAFLDDFLNDRAPEVSERDHVGFDDAAILDKAERLSTILRWKRSLKNQMKEFEDEEESLRKELISSAKDQNRVGGGLKMTRSITKGVINYSDIPELIGVDLEKYRGPSKVKWTITPK